MSCVRAPTITPAWKDRSLNLRLPSPTSISSSYFPFSTDSMALSSMTANMENNTYYLHPQSPSNGVIAQFLDKATTATASSYITALAVLSILVCGTTRILTGLQCTLYSDSPILGEKKVGVLPYWVPYLGHVFSMFTRFQDFLGEVM